MSAEASVRRENAFLALARIPVVRRMWAAITFSSFGDWLGLLANTALAQQLTASHSVSAQGAAISGVILVRLSPDLLFGPVAAALADKLDRRKLVIGGDLAAGLLYASIALGYNLVWLYVAQFVIEAVGLFTQPAKQVIQTTIVPKPLLATANQISLFSVYGTVPIASGVFALLSAVDRLTEHNGKVNIAIVAALLLNTVSFLVSSGTVFFSRHQIPVAPAARERGQSVIALLREGVGFVRGQRVVKALYIGIIGAFAAGGLTVGVAQLWVRTLDAGAAGYSIMFGTVFTGLAVGMLAGPKVLPGYTRSRVFALAIASAGVSLLVMSLLGDFILAVLFAALVGLFAGMAWIIGYTMIGHEVEDRLRGRVFAFVLSSVRLILLLTIAVGPILAGALGNHSIPVGHDARLSFSGPGLTLLIGGVLAFTVGVYALRRATPSQTTLRSLLRRRILRSDIGSRDVRAGLLVAVDGVDAAATAACASSVAALLRGRGLEVLLTGGEDPVGADALVGTSGAPHLEPETAALLSAAGRAEHVARVVRPALERGSAVVCDRYVLTSMALYGGGRGADTDGVRAVDLWGTRGLQPDLTIVLAGPTPAPSSDADVADGVLGHRDLDVTGVQAVLRDAVDADRDHHLLVEHGDVPGEELALRLDHLVRRRRSTLSTVEREAAQAVVAVGVVGDETAAYPVADDPGDSDRTQPVDGTPAR